MLGIKWLETLGLIEWNFSNLYIKFKLEDCKKELKGSRQTNSTCNGLFKWLRKTIFNVRALLIQMVNIKKKG